MDLGLAGKRAIVTGGSRGIGRAIAQALAAEGCALGLVARGEEGLEKAAAELRAAGARVEVAAVDVTDGPAFAAAVDRLAGLLGGVDVAVANAGGSQHAPTAEAGDELWQQQWELNFLSAARLLRRCVPFFERAGGGAFVAISSISGLEAFGTGPYVCAKAALHGLAKCAAKELAPKNVRVNCVAPGSILFPGGSWDRRLQADPERWKRYVEEWMPFGRFGRPEEVAQLVAFVCSPRAHWVTGATLVADGAQSHSF